MGRSWKVPAWKRIEPSPPRSLWVSSMTPVTLTFLVLSPLPPPVSELTRSPTAYGKPLKQQSDCMTLAIVDASDSNTRGYQVPAHTMLEASTRKGEQVAAGRFIVSSKKNL